MNQDVTDTKLLEIRRQVLATAFEMKQKHVKMVVEQFDRSDHTADNEISLVRRLQVIGCSTEDIIEIMDRVLI